MGTKPSKAHQIDRYPDVDGDYKPGNTRWATPQEQGVNKRKTKMVLHPNTGKPIAAADLARALGWSYHRLRAWMIKEGTWNSYNPILEDLNAD
jgi:hypothetical protein